MFNGVASSARQWDNRNAAYMRRCTINFFVVGHRRTKEASSFADVVVASPMALFTKVSFLISDSSVSESIFFLLSQALGNERNIY